MTRHAIDRLSGRARRQFAYRLRRQFPRPEPAALRDLRGRLRGLQDGAAELGDDSDRELDRRAGRRHPLLLPASGLHIVGETFLPIHFQLLAVPGARIEDLRTVHSHVHALGQCRKIIRRHKLQPVVAGDTAGSAREIAEWADKSRASLATRLAGEIYGLQTLASTSRTRRTTPRASSFCRATTAGRRPATRPVVTTFVFRVRNVPAALYKALGGFATNGVNMTKLESYMVEGEFTATQFLADVDGHPEDPPLARALEELTFFSREVRILGVYPAHPFRSELQVRSG